MKELIEYVAKAIVNEPGEVVVTEEDSDRGMVIKLQVAPVGQPMVDKVTGSLKPL